MTVKIKTPLTKDVVKTLHAGDNVEISGTIYTARDAAHKRFIFCLDNNEKLPVDFKDSIIYFAGPSPAKPGSPTGSIGPTTSYRMDPYSPKMISDTQLTGMIGKGIRDKNVISAMQKFGAVYFCAIGGCAALLAKCVKSSEVVAYDDLGAEALRRLEVEDFPVTVVIDCYGNNLYEIGRQEYLNSLERKKQNAK